jgi:cytochrome c peroxidase
VRSVLLSVIAGGLAAFGLASVPLPGSPPADVSTLLRAYARPDAGARPTPADNAVTPEKAALGKALFFDPRLSASGKISCASCHDPAHGWQDGRARGIGEHGTVLARHTPTLLNIAWSEPLFWDGRAETLEEQAKGPLSQPGEMNLPPDKAVGTLRAIPGYAAAFARAYPGQAISVETMVGAMASYERTMESGIAPFDKWVAGDRHAVSQAAKRGFVLFNNKAKCAACHSGWRFTDDGFHDIGLPGQDMGRGKLMPGLTVLEHAFKTPTLRNVAARAPYMHDGSLGTLASVIDHYDRGYVDRPSLAPEMRRPPLSQREKADLLAFLRTLTSRDPAVRPPPLPR